MRQSVIMVGDHYPHQLPFTTIYLGGTEYPLTPAVRVKLHVLVPMGYKGRMKQAANVNSHEIAQV